MADAPADHTPTSNWREATREHLQLLDAVRLLCREHFELFGTWPSRDWLAKQIGLSP